MESSKERIEAQICAYVDGGLSGEEKAEIERHLASNPQHRALIAELIQHKALLQDLPRATVPGDLNEGLTGQLERHSLLGDDAERPVRASIFRIHRWPQFASIAAVIILAVGLGIVVTYVLPPSRGRGVAIKEPAGTPRTPVATTLDAEKDALARGKETELRLSKSVAGVGGDGLADGVVAEKMKQQMEENLAQADTGLGRGLGQNQGEVRAKDAYSFRGYDNSVTPGGGAGGGGASVPVGTVVGLQQTRQLLEYGASLTANYGDGTATWRKGDAGGVITQNAPADERTPRLAVPAGPGAPAHLGSASAALADAATANTSMVCLVVSTDSPATVNGHLGTYLRDNNIRYAFTEVADGKLLGEQGGVRGDRLGAGVAGMPQDVRARITVQDKAAKETQQQGAVAGGVPLVGQTEVFKESETPSRGAGAGAGSGSGGERGRGGFGGGGVGGASDAVAQRGRSGGAATPAPAQRPGTADMPPAGGAGAAEAAGRRRAVERSDEYAKAGEPVAGREKSDRLGAADSASRVDRTEEEKVAAKSEAAQAKPGAATPAQQAGKPVDDATARTWSYGTEPVPGEKKSAAAGAGADTTAAVPPAPDVAPAAKPQTAPANQPPPPGQVAANAAEADRHLDLAKRNDPAARDGAAGQQGQSLSLAYDPQADSPARGGQQGQVESQLRRQPGSGQPAVAVPVPAGNGIILARMSRRQLSELGMKLNGDPMAQKTEIHETAQVALDDVTFKVPLAVGAAAAPESRAVRDLAALGPVTLREQDMDEQRSVESDRTKLNAEAKNQAKPSDAGTSGLESARPRPDAAQEPRSRARGEDLAKRFHVPAPPTTRPTATPATTTAPVSMFAVAGAGDPMDQPIEVLIVVQSPEAGTAAAAPAPAPATVQPANPAAKESVETKK